MNKTYIPALITIVFLALLHKLSIDNYWYVRFSGFDIFMHIIGGMGLAFSLYWVLTTFMPQYHVSFWSLIGLTFAAGILWELFEVINNIAGAPFGTPAYYLDTSKDLVNDTLGAIIAAFFTKRK